MTRSIWRLSPATTSLAIAPIVAISVLRFTLNTTGSICYCIIMKILKFCVQLLLLVLFSCVLFSFRHYSYCHCNCCCLLLILFVFVLSCYILFFLLLSCLVSL